MDWQENVAGEKRSFLSTIRKLFKGLKQLAFLCFLEGKL